MMTIDKGERGQIWVSAVLYLLIGTIVIVLILEAGLPIIQKSKDKSVYTRTSDTFVQIDNVISEVIEEGPGSQRVVSIEIPEGKISMEDDALKWEMFSETQIVEPRTEIRMGNVRVLSDVDVDSTGYDDHYTLENSFLAVNISRVDQAQPMAAVNTSELIESFYVKATGQEMAGTGSFSFIFDDDPMTAVGTGYTEIVPPGNNTNGDFARVLVHVFSDSGNNYTLSLTLESRADFVKIDVPEFE